MNCWWIIILLLLCNNNGGTYNNSGCGCGCGNSLIQPRSTGCDCASTDTGCGCEAVNTGCAATHNYIPNCGSHKTCDCEC